MLQSQSLGSSIADFCRSIVLNSTRIKEACLNCPFSSVGFEEFERCAVKLNECLSDNVRSMFIILVIGMPPATHSSAGAERLETLDR